MSASLDHERIAVFRKLEGLTQTGLADHVGVAQGTVSKVESGDRDPEDLIELILDTFDYPREFFQAPTRQAAGSLMFRKQSQARKGDTERVRALFEEVYRIGSTLRDGDRLPSPSFSSPSADVALDAARTRAMLGVAEDEPIRHLTRRLEQVGVIVFPLVLRHGNVSEQLLGHSGASMWQGIWDAPVIATMPGIPGDRLRWTVAHEVGHLHRHGSGVTEPTREIARALEHEANTYASHLLVPPSALRRARVDERTPLRDFAALKAGWGMSVAALIMHSRNIGLITRDRATSLFKQLSARGWRKHEPVKVGMEQPVLLRQLLERRFGVPIDWDAAERALLLPREVLLSVAPEHTELTA